MKTNVSIVDGHQVREFIESYYTPRVLDGLRNIDARVLEEVSEKIAHRIREGRRIFGFGNGGSEAMSEAFIYALERRISPEFQFDTYSNPKLSEAIDTPNHELFNHRIRQSGRDGDLAMLVSASGDSENINNVSSLCKEKGVETISISGNGRIANDPRTKADYSWVIPIRDQQIQEDVALGCLFLITEIVERKVSSRNPALAVCDLSLECRGWDTVWDIDGSNTIDHIKERYVNRLETSLKMLSPSQIVDLASDIIDAYRAGRQVRVDAPDSGLLSTNAQHMQHNLKWDAFQDIRTRLPNRVYSGVPSYHLSGVGNDGGDRFNYAIEIDDNHQSGDVEVLFVKSIASGAVKPLKIAAEKKGMKVHLFNFNVENEYLASNLAQSVLHLTSRVIHARLIWEQDCAGEFLDYLRQDVAMLRQKDTTRQKLKAVYITNG